MNNKILIVSANYYKEISKNLMKSATTFLNEKHIVFNAIEVPGALEIPQALNLQLNICEEKEIFYTGYIALGCVIKGETYHFEIVSNETNRSLMNIALKNSFPLGNGIITAYNYD